MRTGPDVFGCVAKSLLHATIEYIECPFPEPVITILFTIFHDAAIYLIDIFEAPIFHESAQDLAAYASSAIGNDCLFFESIILIRFDLADEVVRGPGFRDNSILEFSDRCLIRITPIKEYDVLTALLYEFVERFWFEMFATTDYAGMIDLYFVWHAKGN